MCGIVGVYGYRQESPGVDAEELLAIRDSMLTRGPDGCGAWFAKGKKVALAHRRLSIIDLSEEANQPMSTTDEKFVISFNGEIYNYQELREKLLKEGVVFKSNSDTEVLLQMYKKYGTEMFAYLRGMYAFIIWDDQENKMIMARDPYGIKPLYYADDGERILIASSVKALLKSKQISRKKSARGLAGFLSWGSVPEPLTIYEDIKQLPAASYLEIQSDKANDPVSFYSISEQFSFTQPSKKIKEDIHEALLESISYHFVSDVPVGIFLSSGIDSAALLSLVKELEVKDVTTVTVTFEEFLGSSNDEGPLAERFAEELGYAHVNRIVTHKEFEEELPNILKAMDQPSIDGINMYFASKAAKEVGLKVVLSGVGGDELFGGYPSFGVIPRWMFVGKFLKSMPGAAWLYRHVFVPLLSLIKPLSPKALGFTQYASSLEGAYYLKRALFLEKEIEKVAGKEISSKGLSELNIEESLREKLIPKPKNNYGKIATLESCQYMRNQLLRDADWAGMAHSVEIRTPLVDCALLSRLAPLLNCQSQKGKKQLFAKSLKNKLPDYIALRKKTGFGLPMDHWIKEKKRSVCEKVHWSRIWAEEIYKHIQVAS